MLLAVSTYLLHATYYALAILALLLFFGLQDPYAAKMGAGPLSANYSVSEASSLVVKPSVVDYSDLASILIDGFDVCKVCPARI